MNYEYLISPFLMKTNIDQMIYGNEENRLPCEMALTFYLILKSYAEQINRNHQQNFDFQHDTQMLLINILQLTSGLHSLRPFATLYISVLLQ